MLPVDRLIDALCRPFAENFEYVLTTRARLADRLGKMAPETLDGLTRRVEKADAKGFRQWRPWALVTGLILALAIFAVEGFGIRNRQVLAITWAGSMVDDHPIFYPLGIIPGIETPENIAPLALRQLNVHLSAAEQIRFFGDPYGAIPDKLHPDDPAQYLNAVRAGLTRNPTNGSKRTLQEWPSDFPVTGVKIDPDNAWFPLQQASETLGPSVAENYSRGKKTASVYDPVGLENGMRLFAEAAKCQHCRSYHEELLRYRSSKIFPAGDQFEQLLRLILIQDGMHRRQVTQTLLLGVQAKAALLATAGDRDGLLRLASDWLAVSRHLQAAMVDGTDAEGALDFVVRGGSSLIEALRGTCQLEAATRIETILTILKPFREGIKGQYEWGNERASGLSRWITQYPVMHRVPTTAYEPQRRSIRAIIDRIMVWEGLGFVLILIGLLTGSAFCHSAWNRAISARLPFLLDRKDRLWIRGVGIALPAAFFFTLSFLTPLGCRDYGDIWLNGFAFGAQVGGAVFLSIALTLEMTVWRLGKRFPATDGRSGRLGITRWILPSACAGIVVGAGCLRYWDWPQIDWYYFFERPLIYNLVFGIPVLGILMRIAWLTFSRSEESWLNLGVLRVTQRALLGLVFVLIATIPLSIYTERYWTIHDPLFSGNPEHLGYGPAYHAAVMEFKKGLAEALNTK